MGATAIVEQDGILGTATWVCVDTEAMTIWLPYSIRKLRDLRDVRLIASDEGDGRDEGVTGVGRVGTPRDSCRAARAVFRARAYASPV